MSLASTAKVAVWLTLEGGSAFVKGVSLGGDAIRTLGGGLSAANQHLFFFLNNVKMLGGAIGRLGENALGAILGPNNEIDQSIEKMQYFGDSLEQVKARMDKLFRVSGSMDVPYREAIKADIALRRMGDAAFATDENMRLAANAAKFADTGYAELVTTLGRVYNGLQAGKDVGGLLRPLAGMGLIKGATIAEIEKQMDAAKEYPQAVEAAQKKLDALNKRRGETMDETAFVAFHNEVRAAEAELDALAANPSVINWREIWKQIIEELKSVTKHVENAGKTAGDQIQRLSDVWFVFKGGLGEPLFDNLKAGLVSIRGDTDAAFDKGVIEDWAKVGGNAILAVAQTIKEGTLGGLTAKDFFSAAEQGNLGSLLKVVFEDAAHNLWEAIKAGASKYGPDIAAAIIPKRLAGPLGITQGAAMRSAASHGGGLTEEEKAGMSYGAMSRYYEGGMIQEGIPRMVAAWLSMLPTVHGMMAMREWSMSPAQLEAQKNLWLNATGVSGPYQPQYVNPGQDWSNRLLTLNDLMGQIVGHAANLNRELARAEEQPGHF